MPPVTTQPPLDPAPGPAPRKGYSTGSGYGYGYGSGYPAQTSGDFARTWHTIVEKAWVVALSTAVLLGIGYAYIRRAPVLYSATATIQVEQDPPNLLRMQQIQNKDLQAVDYLQTVAQSLNSRPLLERVADTNNLWTDPRFKTATTNAPSRAKVKALDALDKMVKVKLRRGTRLIDITVTHRVPELTEEIANSIVSEFLNAVAERESASISLANMSLASEAERLRKKLEESEHALQAYKEENKTTSLDTGENTVGATLKELSTKATDAKAIRIQAETDNAQAMSLGTNIETLLVVPTVAKDPTVLALEISLTKAEDDFAALSKRYKSKHPKYIQATTLISELKSDITKAVLNAVRTLNASLEGAKATEQSLNAALEIQAAAWLELSKLSIPYGVLAREVESDRALYDSVLKGMKEADVTKQTLQTGVIRVVVPAYAPDSPVSPRKALILAGSGMAGLFLGLLVILGLGVSNTSIKTVDEAETILNLFVFSAVPNIRSVKKDHNQLVVQEKARSEGAEAFRTLRTSLAMRDTTEKRQVFLFTSAMPAEGKTFCSVNFATSLAQLGLKTVVIDADLRRPSVETFLTGQPGDHPGLTNYLKGEQKLQEVVRPTKIENLFFISGGATAPNPAELLAKDGLTGIIQEALQHYDRVVVDSAPVNAVSDTLLILKNVQTVCLVVRAAWTSSRFVLRCVQQLQGAGAPISGIVLNRMPRHRAFGHAAYYDYRYHGKYGKKGVYGATS